MMIGRVLNDRYEVVQFVGQGGMAKVYLGFDKVLNRDVAIKILQEEFNDNEQFLNKFKREAQAAGKLSHPHIVNIYDTGNDHDIYYIVMEYVDGGTLKDYINAKGKLSYRESINYALAIASALGQAHKNNIIHRDVKPQNILLTRAKRLPKVADFGIARAITSSTMTMVDETMGSVHYLSPEQARGGYLDARSDLYSLGILLYEMVTGKLPFDSDSPVAVALMQIQEDIVPLREIDPDAPRGLEVIIQNLTAKSPNDRYQDTLELIEDLKKVRADFNAHINRIGAEDTSPTEKIPIIRDEEIEQVPKRVPLENNDNYDELREKDKKKKNKDKGKKKGFKNLPLKMKILAVVLAVMLVAGGVFAGTRIFAKEVTVPNITNMTVEQATAELAKVGLKAASPKMKNSVDVDEGKIISQSPKQGIKIKTYQKVEIVVSSGPADVKVPDVIGLQQVEAESKITNTELVVKVVSEYRDDVKKGEVFKQEPSAGEEVKQGNTVTIYVSKGENKVTMESLTGMSLSDAKARIKKLGLSVGEISYETSSRYSKDVVISSSPEQYEEVTVGSSVDLTVSKGKLQKKSMSIDIGDYSNSTGKRVKVEIVYVDPDGGTSTAYSGRVKDTDIVNVTFEGYGVGYYKVYIDGSEKGNGGIVTF
ncbi:Stk1 family PASTA domain-containing Ser/Thr kinase [Anaerofustis stercorihominis]|uniref:non-specific serine/threonine protein kinase n=2 Tax=Anaerofustis stercorihominis TaxID=214853 RepID=B1C5S7_9FIRM|nr:Stk1 family PASTA domain-containing Ser/Thr kinase [Anaerofustis stercorihominis]EDS73641.1 kinase domain protein [Anaerofustis stercorihominis DSM 17244]MCQ4794695.1 Stk1 family PASTA domain-containing Ser/Thr kinase [Anaerofustis stercorihominis]